LFAIIIVEPTPAFKYCWATSLAILAVEFVLVFAPESEPKKNAFEARSRSALGDVVNSPSFPF
jgi:hypothetical protein